MQETNLELPLAEIKPNEENPRQITDENLKKLVNSIQEFPEMLKVRRVVIDENNVILGGNMRLKALSLAGVENVPVTRWEGLTEDQKKEFIVKDNVGYGKWDWDILTDKWPVSKLGDWGVTVPTVKNTELLSGLEYEPLYYEPTEIPNITLEHCVDLEKFNAKLAALDEYNLTKKQKEVLKLFAYRFIKIDFEMVANYYSFNATEEEQKAIERLRLVLTDNGVNGFIEDDLLRVLFNTPKDEFDS